MSEDAKKQWYIKELSEITKVSVRTLHYYDRVNLLKPTVRLSNGYRLYSESDLVKLQQILALKFFGFELSRIKTLMKAEINPVASFQAQESFLLEKAKGLEEAAKILKATMADWSSPKSIPWEKVIELIGVYNMTQELEKTWAAKVYTPEQLKQFAGMKSRFSDKDIEEYQQKWTDIIEETKQYLNQDPRSEFAKSLGKRWLDLVNSAYGGAENFPLRTRIWDAYKNDEIPNSPIPRDVVLWIDQAMDAYIRERIYSVLAKVGNSPEEKVAKEWAELLEYMYGHDQAPKDALYTAALADDNVSDIAKEWLKKSM